jgi:tetratricopeptide (TPR) repeat protein
LERVPSRGGVEDKDLHQRLFVLENRREDYKTALRHLEATAAMSPDDPDLWMLLGDYHLFLKLYPQARDVYEKITAKWPVSTGAQTRIAEVYMAEGRYDKAISTIEGVLVEAPDHPHARLLRGLLWIREGETDKARTEIVKALEADPISAEGYYLYGLSFLKEGDYGSSLPQILRAVEMGPDSLKARLALAYVYSKMGHFFLSLNELDQILAARPEHPRARALRATVRIHLKDYEGAAFDYRYLIDRGLSTPEMPFHLADIYRAQGRLDQALNVVSRGLAKDPDSRKGLKTKVRILVAQGAYEQAVDACDGYLKKRPDNLEFGILKAGILLKQKKYGDAETLLTRLIKQHPQSYSPLMLMAKTLRKQRKLSQALIYYRQAVERDPAAIEAHMEMAEAYVLVGQFDKAIDAYEAVLTIDATYGPALNDLAYLYAERGQKLDRALSLALRAFEQMPENPAVRDTLGWAYLKKGSVLLGKTHLAEAVRLGSKNPLFHYHFGIALHESDDLSGAHRAFSEAVRLGLEGKELAAARNRMQQIKARGAS